MSLSSVNYPQPVQVNGFTCRNCTDVDYAKKHIDPEHPKSGPFNLNAATDPTRKHPLSTSAVAFGGSLSDLNGDAAASAGKAASAPGSLVDLSA